MMHNDMKKGEHYLIYDKWGNEELIIQFVSRTGNYHYLCIVIAPADRISPGIVILKQDEFRIREHVSLHMLPLELL